MTAVLSSTVRRSRFLLSWDAASCLGAVEQSLSAATGQAGTFTRASVKVAKDASGTPRLIANSLPGFEWVTDSQTGLMSPALYCEGAYSLQLTAPSDFSNVAWTKTTTTVGTGIADPVGGTGACTLTATGASSTTVQALAAGSSTARTNSVWLRRRTGTGTIGIRDAKDTAYTTVVLSTAWQRFTVTSTASVNRTAGILIATSGDAVDAYVVQMDDAAFATSTAPVARSADAMGLAVVPVTGTIYVRYWDYATAAIIETATAYTSSAAITFQSNAGYLAVKVASGTVALATMQTG